MTERSADRRAIPPGRRSWWLAIPALIACLVVLRSVIGWRGYFLGDDFAIRYRAASQPWSLDYAFEPYNDHVSPIGYSLEWVLQALFPGSYTAVVVATSVLLALTLGFSAALMWVLTGRVRAAVLACVTVGLGLFTFEVGTWWCTTVYSMTYLAFTAAALWALARAVRRGGPWWPALVAYVAAALSDSKGFLSILLLFGLAAGVAILPDGPLGVRGAWRSLRGLWLASGVVSLGMAGLSALSTSGVQGDPSVGRAARMMWDLWVINIAPAVLGGPWWWFEVPNVSWPAVRVLPAPPGFIGVMCLVACAVALVAIVRRRPQVSGFVPWALLYALAATALPVLGRSGTNLASPAYRYTFDLVLPVTILLCLGLVPIWWQEGGRRARAWIVAGALAVSMVASTVVPAAAWGRNEARDYMGRAVLGFADIPPDQTVIAQRVPEDLVPGLLWQYANTRAVMSPQPGAPVFSDTTRGTLYGFADDGSVEVQDVEGPTSPEGPDRDCGYAVTSTPRTIPLDGRLIEWSYLARVAYFSQTDTVLNMAVGGQINTVDLPASGLDAVYFPVSGPGEEVLVSVGTPGVTVCVTEVRIGNRISPRTGAVVPFEPRGFG
ncbi:MAG: hypothetical protein R2720_11370 [Candidatus Nanopelagicales bacterium]